LRGGVHAPSQKIGRELGTHKRSCPDLKRLTMLGMLSPDLSEVRVGTHTRSCPDLKHLTTLAMLSPDLSEVRVQHLSAV
jgi:hypothetical protein